MVTSAEEEGESAVAEVINESCSSKVKPLKRHRNKAGRKTNWRETTTNDLVDIICNSEMYQRKLIFANIRLPKMTVITIKLFTN